MKVFLLRVIPSWWETDNVLKNIFFLFTVKDLLKNHNMISDLIINMFSYTPNARNEVYNGMANI